MMSLVEPLLKPLVDRINASPNGIFLDAKINGVVSIKCYQDECAHKLMFARRRSR